MSRIFTNGLAEEEMFFHVLSWKEDLDALNVCETSLVKAFSGEGLVAASTRGFPVCRSQPRDVQFVESARR